MNIHRAFTLIAASALSPWLAFSTFNGHTAAGNTIRTSYPLEGRDSIVTTIDGKIVSIEIVEKGSSAVAADTKKKKMPTDTTTLVAEDNAAATVTELEHQYRMKLLENEHEINKLRIKSEENKAKIDASRSRSNSVEQTIATLSFCIGLPLLFVFVFLSYRLRVRNKRNNDFEKFLTDLVKNGQPLSPELVTALCAHRFSRTPRCASGTASDPSDTGAEPSLSNLDEEGFRALEKETFRYCARRACLAAATLLLIFWVLISHLGQLHVLLFIPFLFFLFQGGIRFLNFYIEKRYRNTSIREKESPRKPEEASPDDRTPSRPAASSAPTETANPDRSLDTTL